MQDFSSTASFTPSFSYYASGDGGIAEVAVRVVRESHSVQADDDYEAEFEFETLPLGEESFFHFPTTTFIKRSSADDDVAKSIFYGGWNIDQSLSSPSQSHSSSESDDSEKTSPSRYYCFWSPIRSPARDDSLKSKPPRKCSFKDLLRRCHSDGAASTSGEPKRCRFKNFLSRSHSEGRSSGGEGSPISYIGNESPALKGKHKTTSYKLTNVAEVVKRRKTYLPYRQNLIGVFAGMSRFRR